MSLDRGLLLYEQSRYDLAETELRRLVIQNPQDPEAHRLLASALSGAEKYHAALQEAREAVRLGPDDADACHTLAAAHFHLDQHREAEAALPGAMELDPQQPHHYGLLAGIRAKQDKWAQCLAAAEEGLALDPEHADCTGFRTMALTRLGRHEQAREALEGALARDPENEITHCHQGWSLLHQGKGAEALGHFREALRIDPRYEYARHGLIEAMKARNPVYAQILRALLWASRWPPSAQWAFAIGYIVVMRTLDAAVAGNPVLKAGVTVLRFLFALLWIVSISANPLFTLALRFSREGRRVLDADQRAASNVHAALLAGVVLSFASAALPYVRIAQATMSALVCGFLIMVAAEVYTTPRGAARRWMKAYAVALGLLGLLGVWAPQLLLVLVLVLGWDLPSVGVLKTMLRLWIIAPVVFLVGALASDWVSKKLAAWQRAREEREAYGRA